MEMATNSKQKRYIMNYFQRQIELFGEEKQANLKTKNIAIVGCGGLGSTLGIALGSSGIGKVHLIDFDIISLHNIHRQIAFTLNDENKSKAKTLAKLIESRYDGVETKVHECKFEDFAETKLDLIIDATDNLPTRAQIDKFAKKHQIPWLYGSVEEFNSQVCFFEKSSFDSFSINDRKAKGQTAPMVMQTASFQANLALRYLAGFEVAKDLLYYLFYDKNGEFVIKTFKMP